MQLEEKIGRKSFAITRWGEGGAFWACIVNSVAVVTFPSFSDERAEKRGREREREMEQREKVKWNEKQERGERYRQGLFNHNDLRDVHEFHAQCAIDMAVSHNLDTGTWSPLSSFSFVDIVVYTVGMLPSLPRSSHPRFAVPVVAGVVREEIKEIPLWRSGRSTTSLREMGCVCRNGISGEKSRRSMEDVEGFFSLSLSQLG